MGRRVAVEDEIRDPPPTPSEVGLRPLEESRIGEAGTPRRDRQYDSRDRGRLGLPSGAHPGLPDGSIPERGVPVHDMR